MTHTAVDDTHRHHSGAHDTRTCHVLSLHIAWPDPHTVQPCDAFAHRIKQQRRYQPSCDARPRCSAVASSASGPDRSCVASLVVSASDVRRETSWSSLSSSLSFGASRSTDGRREPSAPVAVGIIVAQVCSFGSLFWDVGPAPITSCVTGRRRRAGHLEK